jgi:hypothetical protein
VEYMTEMTLIEALERLALITKNGLDTRIQVPDTISEPITINEAIKAIKEHAVSETDNYVISGDGIRKIGDEGYLGDVIYQVIEDV